METSLTNGWGVGVLTLLLMGEPCQERFTGEGGSGEGVRSRWGGGDWTDDAGAGAAGAPYRAK